MWSRYSMSSIHRSTILFTLAILKKSCCYLHYLSSSSGLFPNSAFTSSVLWWSMPAVILHWNQWPFFYWLQFTEPRMYSCMLLDWMQKKHTANLTNAKEVKSEISQIGPDPGPLSSVEHCHLLPWILDWTQHACKTVKVLSIDFLHHFVI